MNTCNTCKEETDQFDCKKNGDLYKCCKECRAKITCKHGRIRSKCKECGGASICEHGRQRNLCKECGGASICEHGRRRNQCKECGGSIICEHGRQRNLCKECGGASICEHGRQRNRCKECGGASICEHGRIRNQCKECGGASICEHGRRRNRCKECGGSSICEHGRIRNQCKECGGSSICEHGRQRNQCKECGGASICEHGRQRNLCKECGGSSICEHGRQRNQCIKCNPNAACSNCEYVCILKSKYKPYCAPCYYQLNPDVPKPKRFMLRQDHFVSLIKSEFSQYKFVFDRQVNDGCSGKRPDAFLDCLTHSIIVENDENQHQGYDDMCENKRMMMLFRDLGDRPIVFIRFNPDSYRDENGRKHPSCFTDKKKNDVEWEKRSSVLCTTIKAAIHTLPIKTITVEYLFYSAE